jgi:hypothetical protein
MILSFAMVLLDDYAPFTKGGVEETSFIEKAAFSLLYKGWERFIISCWP